MNESCLVPVPANRTAVLVVDMQNDTVHADGAYAVSGAVEHAAAQHVIANVATVVDAARSAGSPVFHSRIVVYPLPGLNGGNAPVFRMLAPDTFKAGSWADRRCAHPARRRAGLGPDADERVQRHRHRQHAP